MKTKKSSIAQYFRISNLIEWVDDESEDYKSCAKYTTWEDYLDFHESLWYLSSHCTPWKFRKYQVTVGWQETLDYIFIESEIRYLFSKYRYPTKDSTFSQILDWHIAFEKIHPFWDWNGRTGRYLMALQCKKARCLKELFICFKWEDISLIRSKYYNLF